MKSLVTISKITLWFVRLVTRIRQQQQQQSVWVYAIMSVDFSFFSFFKNVDVWSYGNCYALAMIVLFFSFLFSLHKSDGVCGRGMAWISDGVVEMKNFQLETLGMIPVGAFFLVMLVVSDRQSYRHYQYQPFVYLRRAYRSSFFSLCPSTSHA